MEWQPLAPNVVTNPPYRHVAPFMRAGLRSMTGKMALLLRLALEGVERWQIYENSPLARSWVFARRISMRRAGYDGPSSSGITAFAWFVWDRAHSGRRRLGRYMISECDLRLGERATRGPRPGDRPPAVGTDPPKVRLLAFKSMRMGTLLGFARVDFPHGLQISNIPIFAGQNGPFAALPSRPVLDQEGRQKRDVNGNLHYLPFLQWRDWSLSGWFSDSTAALVLKANAEFASGHWSGQ
jgi:hypothetical protein